MGFNKKEDFLNYSNWFRNESENILNQGINYGVFLWDLLDLFNVGRNLDADIEFWDNFVEIFQEEDVEDNEEEEDLEEELEAVFAKEHEVESWRGKFKKHGQNSLMHEDYFTEETGDEQTGTYGYTILFFPWVGVHEGLSQDVLERRDKSQNNLFVKMLGYINEGIFLPFNWFGNILPTELDYVIDCNLEYDYHGRPNIYYVFFPNRENTYTILKKEEEECKDELFVQYREFKFFPVSPLKQRGLLNNNYFNTNEFQFFRTSIAYLRNIAYLNMVNTELYNETEGHKFMRRAFVPFNEKHGIGIDAALVEKMHKVLEHKQLVYFFNQNNQLESITLMDRMLWVLKYGVYFCRDKPYFPDVASFFFQKSEDITFEKIYYESKLNESLNYLESYNANFFDFNKFKWDIHMNDFSFVTDFACHNEIHLMSHFEESDDEDEDEDEVGSYFTKYATKDAMSYFDFYFRKLLQDERGFPVFRLFLWFGGFYWLGHIMVVLKRTSVNKQILRTGSINYRLRRLLDFKFLDEVISPYDEKYYHMINNIFEYFSIKQIKNLIPLCCMLLYISLLIVVLI